MNMIINYTLVLTSTPSPLMVDVKIAISKHWITLCWPPPPFQTIKTLISTVWPSNTTKIKYVQFKISKTSQIKNVFSSGPGSSPRNVIVRPLSSSTMVSLSRIFLSYYLIIIVPDGKFIKNITKSYPILMYYLIILSHNHRHNEIISRISS